MAKFFEETQAFRTAMLGASEDAKRELKLRIGMKLGPGKHSVEALNRAAREAMVEIGDAQLEALALLIGEEP